MYVFLILAPPPNPFVQQIFDEYLLGPSTDLGSREIDHRKVVYMIVRW